MHRGRWHLLPAALHFQLTLLRGMHPGCLCICWCRMCFQLTLLRGMHRGGGGEGRGRRRRFQLTLLRGMHQTIIVIYPASKVFQLTLLRGMHQADVGIVLCRVSTSNSHFCAECIAFWAAISAAWPTSNSHFCAECIPTEIDHHKLAQLPTHTSARNASAKHSKE